MAIKVLSPQVAAQIAAGEVVERPVSVVKELVENAIDAGATDIQVEIQSGGKRLIRVSDNGAGIPSDEVELTVARHATSKISTANDLFHISTLGFRGEALASIAAVSRFTLSTRTEAEVAGTQIRVENGDIIHRESVGRPPGTSVTVENLFYNVPARRKFLRSDGTETEHISHMVSRYALARPDIRFRLVSNRRAMLQTMGSGALYDVVVKVYDVDAAKQMVEVSAEDGAEIGVAGYVGLPTLYRSNSKHITFFVNGRWIQDRSLSYAVTQAYHGMLMKGQYPVLVLNITLPPAEVDVNVHPTKAEVKFRNPQQLFSAVQKTVRRALLDQGDVVPRATAWQEREAQMRAHWRPTGGNSQLAMEVQRTLPDDVGEPAFRAPKMPMLRVLGQVATTYIIAEGPEGMYLIDQHAAHERIKYEEFLRQRAAQDIAVQELLEPLTIDLSPQQLETLEEERELLAELGFSLEPWGGDTYLLRAVPAILGDGDYKQALTNFLDEMAEGGDASVQREEAIARLACHNAIRGGQTLSLEEMKELIRQMEMANDPRHCPHGRPTMILLSAEQLAKEFGRK